MKKTWRNIEFSNNSSKNKNTVNCVWKSISNAKDTLNKSKNVTRKDKNYLSSKNKKSQNSKRNKNSMKSYSRIL